MFLRDVEINEIRPGLWEIPKQGSMLVPGRIYTNKKMIDENLSNDDAVKQVVNVAHLPGIQKYSLAMPDIHWGYGFPIGGVAATDYETGVISPGGVGYDINCGVRLASTFLNYDDIRHNIKKLIGNLYNNVPTGVGSSGAIKKLNEKDLKQVLIKGSEWAVENGFGSENDIVFTEEKGRMDGADPAAVSQRAVERGLDQAGTLGSGNHFLEIDIVDEIYDKKAAEVMGLAEGRIVVLIHTGSRGLGYQICDDYIKKLMKSLNSFNIKLPDKQLVCAPIKSGPGQDYLSAMKCAANFAWNNRQIIMALAKKSIKQTLSISDAELGFNLVYDVCHNIAKIEEHNIDGSMKRVCVHRKGATRAFPPKDKNIPSKYSSIGQPVIIPGDMGRYSYVLTGTDQAMRDTFGSSCHGAGRVKSRNKALKEGKGRNLIDELHKSGIEIRAKGRKTVAEEMPYAYKDVSDVVEVVHSSGIGNKVAKIRPLGVIKG